MTQSPGVVPKACKYFRTRLSDRKGPDLLWAGPGCVCDRHGARDKPACHRFSGHFSHSAVSGTFGAVQLASGHDLTGSRQLASNEPAGEINRGAKADRAARKAAQNLTETVTIRSVNLADTSVVGVFPVSRAGRPIAVHARRDTQSPGTGGQAEADDRLRTPGQRFDRGRQTSPARPLRDLNGAFRDP